MDGDHVSFNVTVMVDSSPSHHFFDPSLMPGWCTHSRDDVVLIQSFKVYGLGDHVLDGDGFGTIWGTVLDYHQRHVPIDLSFFIVPGLGGNLMSVKVRWQGCGGHIRE